MWNSLYNKPKREFANAKENQLKMGLQVLLSKDDQFGNIFQLIYCQKFWSK
jgi:hypothetical protein